MSRRIFAAFVAAVGLGVTLAPAAGAETLKLDSRQGGVPVSTSTALQSGAYYLATASGTFSYYQQSIWQGLNPPLVVCGTPEAITEPSAGEGPGVGGNDAETIFAAPARFGCGNFHPPIHWANFEMSLNGASFGHVEPQGGAMSTPSADHTYSYLLRGSGQPARFRLVDSGYSDNNGVMTITVRQSTGDDCKKDGWKQFGVFKNQGDCVSFHATNGRNQPAG